STFRTPVSTFPDAGPMRHAYASAHMSPAEHDEADPPPPPHNAPRVDAALADAAALLARAEADETAASAARERYRSQPIRPLDVDAHTAALLEPGERLYAQRAGAILNTTTGSSPIPGYGGTLHVTDRRILHVGRVVVSIRLEQVREIALAGERLLVTFDGGEGISLDLDRPRLLRVEITAMLAAARASR
ncbi:MAG TPA: hypothetical protein VFM74_07900, partial [Candidatus Limnocylindria bacterium]|nr:hypothetical protein [Candidatus Limnocylindria bacterium]